MNRKHNWIDDKKHIILVVRSLSLFHHWKGKNTVVLILNKMTNSVKMYMREIHACTLNICFDRIIAPPGRKFMHV